jgi:Nucleotide modification associated domain 1
MTSIRILNTKTAKSLHTSDEFLKVLDDIKAMHLKKSADYGTDEDPFANVNASTDFGVSGVIGTLIRANDKMRRLQAWAKGSALVNEGVEDSLMDLATYAVIALVQFRKANRED